MLFTKDEKKQKTDTLDINKIRSNLNQNLRDAFKIVLANLTNKKRKKS